MIYYLLLIIIILNPLKNVNYVLAIGPVNWLNLIFIVITIVWFFKKNERWIYHPINKYFLALIGVFIFSFFRSFIGPFVKEPFDALQQIKAIVTELFLFFVFLNFINTKEQISKIAYAIAFVLIYEAFVVSDQYFQAVAELGDTFSWELKSRITATFVGQGVDDVGGTANEVGAYFAMYSLFLIGFGAKQLKKAPKLFFLSAGIIGIIPMLFTQSRSAWLAFVFSLGIFMMRKNQKLLILAAIAAVVAFPFLPDSVSSRISNFGDKSAMSRLDFWLEATTSMGNPIRFLTGIGFGNGILKIGMDTHNSFIRILLETGVLGFIISVLLFYYLARYLNFYHNNVSDYFSNAFLTGTLLSFYAFFILNLFGTRLFNGYLVTAFWGLLGISMKIGVLYERSLSIPSDEPA